MNSGKTRRQLREVIKAKNKYLHHLELKIVEYKSLRNEIDSLTKYNANLIQEARFYKIGFIIGILLLIITIILWLSM